MQHVQKHEHKDRRPENDRKEPMSLAISALSLAVSALSLWWSVSASNHVDDILPNRRSR